MFSSPLHKIICLENCISVGLRKFQAWKKHTMAQLKLYRSLFEAFSLNLSADNIDNHYLKALRERVGKQQPKQSHITITPVSLNIKVVLLPKQKPACPDLTFGRCFYHCAFYGTTTTTKKNNISSFFKKFPPDFIHLLISFYRLFYKEIYFINGEHGSSMQPSSVITWTVPLK